MSLRVTLQVAGGSEHNLATATGATSLPLDDAVAYFGRVPPSDAFLLRRTRSRRLLWVVIGEGRRMSGTSESRGGVSGHVSVRISYRELSADLRGDGAKSSLCSLVGGWQLVRHDDTIKPWEEAGEWEFSRQRVYAMPWVLSWGLYPTLAQWGGHGAQGVSGGPLVFGHHPAVVIEIYVVVYTLPFRTFKSSG